MIRNELYYYRRSKGITQEDMANVLGVLRTTYRDKENGIRNFNFEEAKVVADTLGITLDSVWRLMTTIRDKDSSLLTQVVEVGE